MKIKTNIPNILFFFDFSNPLKQIKIKSFGSKTLLKTRKNEKFAFGKLMQNSPKECVSIAHS